GRERNVADGDDVERLVAAGRAHGDGVALARLEQRARHRRDPAYVTARRINLVDADDAHRALVAAHVRDGDRRAKIDARLRIVVARHRRIDDLGAVEPSHEEAYAPVDLAQPLLAVDVVAVLRAIAVSGGPGDRRDQLRPLLRYERVELAAHPREAAGRHVIARAGRQRRRVLNVTVVVGLARFFAGEGLVHLE